MKPLLEEHRRVSRLRRLVDGALEDLLPDPGDQPHRIHAAMRYALLSPGKRIRPVLALLCAEQLGCAIEVALYPACALEFVHAASLVLDDLPCMDDAKTRRGQPCVHVRYGEGVAVLTGVALLNEAFALIARAPDLSADTRLQMNALLTRAGGTTGLVGGQEQDLCGDAEPTLASLTKTHEQKTGTLFMAAVEIGALAAGADQRTAETLHRFAEELGLAFQALDDLDDADDLESVNARANLLVLLDKEGLRQQSVRKLAEAKAVLCNFGAPIESIGRYVDLLIGLGQREA